MLGDGGRRSCKFALGARLASRDPSRGKSTVPNTYDASTVPPRLIRIACIASLLAQQAPFDPRTYATSWNSRPHPLTIVGFVRASRRELHMAVATVS